MCDFMYVLALAERGGDPSCIQVATTADTSTVQSGLTLVDLQAQGQGDLDFDSMNAVAASTVGNSGETSVWQTKFQVTSTNEHEASSSIQTAIQVLEGEASNAIQSQKANFSLCEEMASICQQTAQITAKKM